MEGYESKVEYSSKELTAKERVMLKTVNDGVALDDATRDGEVIITPDYFAIIAIHNERGEDKDYKKCVVVDKDGIKYVTGSRSFIEAFSEIFDEMRGEDEDYSVKVFRRESKNYKGKQFLSCAII